MPDQNEINHDTQGLVQRARQGDRDGFTLLYARLAPALHTWARLRLPPPIQSLLDPQDLMHEVWWRALEAFRTYDPEKASFRTFLFTIAKRVLIDAMRRSGTAARHGHPAAGQSSGASAVPDSVTDVSRKVARDEILSHVVDALRTLDDTDRDLFIHCGLEGQKPGRVAAVIDLSSEAATKRWQRLRERLRKEVPDGERLLLDGD